MTEISKNAVCLTIASGGAVGRTVALEKKRVTVGRLPANDIVLPDDPLVSGVHAMLSCDEGVWTLEDMNSRNGTYVEMLGRREKLEGRTALQSGQTFLIGRTRVTFQKTSKPESVPGPVSRDGDPVDAEEELAIRIDAEGETLKYQALSAGALGVRRNNAYQRSDIERVNDEIGALMNRSRHRVWHSSEGEATECAAELNALGDYLGRHLIPPEIRGKMARTTGSRLFLMHSAELAVVPWELVVIEETPLCLQFDMGRQLTAEDCSSRNRIDDGQGRKQMLILANPTEDLPEAQGHAESLFAAIQERTCELDVVFLAGPQVERLAVLRALERADFAYYIGHALYDREAPDNSGWILKEGRITCADVQRMRNPPAMVFANGCETSRESSESGTPSRAFGVAGRFILAGVDSYVGAAWPVSAEGSITFAGAFFEGLLTGDPQGRCVRRARETVIARHGREELAWAAYTHYGNPSSRFFKV